MDEVPEQIWVCEDCGWHWPLADVPWQNAECDACGGEMRPEVATAGSVDRLRELVETGRSVHTTGRPIMTMIAEALGPDEPAGST